MVKNEENILIKRRRVMDARKTMRSDVSTNVSSGGGGGGGYCLASLTWLLLVSTFFLF